MSILSTEQVSHSFNDRWLFKDIHFGLQKGDRIALVGINGTGKSTLLSILAEKVIPTSGKVVKEKGIKIGFLAQDPDFSGLHSINDFIYSADNEQQTLIRQYEELLSTDEPDQQKLEDLTEKLSLLNAWEYEYNIKTILNRLNIIDFTQQIDNLSGGQRKRLALAKLLIDEPDVYILDEPTNHLDIETIEWLEKLLTTGNKTVLLVTHDRYFLDGVCTEIRELDRGNLLTFKGNYSYYLEKKAEREANDSLLVEKSRNLLRKELEWMRRQPQARGTKSKSRIEAYYDLEEKSKAAKKNDIVQLSVKVSRQGSKILEIENASKSFGTKCIIENFSYTFKKGDRIGLSGRNGSGKSTFLNLITGIEKPTSGTISVGETTVYGYYKQGGLEFQNNERVIDVVKNVAEYIEMAKGEVITASQLLTHFLFPPEKQFGMVEKLSGGERKRLQLMRVLMRNPNFLILDEPSNDLDIDTLNVLEDFLEKYTGVLLLVSHDRYLVDKLTDQLFIFDGTGKINIYNGNYADFKAEQDLLNKQLKAGKTNVKPVEVKEQPGKKKLSYKEQKEYEDLEKEVTSLEQQIAEKTEVLSSTTDHIQLVEIAEAIKTLESKLEEKTERWLLLAELAE
ncbi:ABC transporter, ATP-binding protein [Sphingobacterium spiritivorum ATCC 33300]|uniref:ABC transporter, ATP-binding protein n=1 Tax=Sphingobacterium spiritivorum ATCC 33300 TaxID=525372 RepID=C2G1P4_SPHSI|nr:ABC-F family ATP-binding cassette domain-containing protein [Sphingobacterium spiritivorum]EEI90953.1 ABC transporter, ATP-binding protein [Sphingobacterium spiritivorum ATCC 33300]QQS97834.1 ABC-F family ATP-binding cassette domain-containing protein [Sphingobacterium spiritivorum]